MVGTDYYKKQLEKINGISFTPREIDIVSFIINGRTAKKIASTLKLSSKTVENYTRNIMVKVGCNSQEGIRDFIERSGDFSFLRDHYKYILLDINFDEWIKNVKPLISSLQITCLLIYENEKINISLLKNIERHLNLSGFKVLSENKKELKSSNSLFNPLDQMDCKIYCLPSNISLSLNITEVLDYIEKFNIHINCIISLQTTYNIASSISTEFKQDCYINFGEDDYYKQFFVLLQKLTPNLSLGKLISDFEKKEVFSITTNEENQKINKILPIASTVLFDHAESFTKLKRFLNKYSKKNWSIASCVFVVVTLALLIEVKKHNVHLNATACSEFRIPADAVFLERPQLINHIKQQLRKESTIQTMALVGIGGSGKTTLARAYAKTQSNSIVWEINAETQESLIDSFTNLAYALAKNKEQREELIFIKSIQNANEKEIQLLLFVKKHLRNNPNWLLIYDNVGSFSESSRFFPYDVNVWGKGHVIITTRNNNITSQIGEKNVIQVDVLTQEEAFTLFYEILHNTKIQKPSLEEKQIMRAFLAKIPPFPLDISLAAYYIKNAHISYEKYLEKLNISSENFLIMQENIIKEISDYAKTRSNIIRLSFQEIIENNSEFKDLLFLICLVDSQNISKNLLEFYKDPVIVDLFIHELKRYSLITINSLKENMEIGFSLHRSTQSLGQSYLVNLLPEEEKNRLLDQIVTVIRKFYEFHVKENHSILCSNIIHFQILLQNLSILDLPKKNNDIYSQKLHFILGYAYKRTARNVMLEKKHFLKVYQLQKKTLYFRDKELAILLKDLASTCADLESSDEAVMYAQESIKILKNIPQSEALIAENFGLLGYSYTYKNDFDLAQFYLKQALKTISYLEPELRKEPESDIYAKLAWLYSVTYITGSKAIEGNEYIDKALKTINGNYLYAQQSSAPNKKISCYIARHKTTLGDIYCRFGNYKEAETQGFKEAQYIIDNSLDSCAHRLLKIYIAIGMGEVYLRKGNLEVAKNKLFEVIQDADKIMGENNELTLSPRIFYVETQIRLGELTEAYENCLPILQIKRKNGTNYVNLMSCIGHYHAAIIQYKQGDFEKSSFHFGCFFKEMKHFGETFFNKKIFKNLMTEKVFDISNSQKTLNDRIKDYLHKSTILLSVIFGKDHPFIKDFVLHN